jgi:hypothetical protein
VLGWRVRAAVVVVVLSLGLIGAAFAVDAYEERGAATTAKVASCETRYKLPPLCRGTWVEGDLLEGGGVVFGTIDGAGRGDIGEEIAVRSDGDSAWTITNRLPYILGGCGVAVALIGLGAGLRRAFGRHASIGTGP